MLHLMLYIYNCLMLYNVQCFYNAHYFTTFSLKKWSTIDMDNRISAVQWIDTNCINVFWQYNRAIQVSVFKFKLLLKFIFVVLLKTIKVRVDKLFFLNGKYTSVYSLHFSIGECVGTEKKLAWQYLIGKLLKVLNIQWKFFDKYVQYSSKLN